MNVTSSSTDIAGLIASNASAAGQFFIAAVLIAIIFSVPVVFLRYHVCGSCAEFIAKYFDDEAVEVGSGAMGEAGLYGITVQERRMLLEEIINFQIHQQRNGLGKIRSKVNSSVCVPTDLSIHADTELSCIICLTEYENGDEIALSRHCPHKFHKDCLLEWIGEMGNDECPVCRVPMVTSSELKEAASRCFSSERLEQLRDVYSDDVDLREHSSGFVDSPRLDSVTNNITDDIRQHEPV